MRVHCDYCPREFDGVANLRRHQAVSHTEEVTVDVPCTWCGTDVAVRVWEEDERHYCSRTCSRAWNCFITLGKRHPQYVDGTSRSGVYELKAMAIRQRDGECRRCGRESADDAGRALHVHHIEPAEEVKDPHRPTNMLSVCASCHGKLESLPPTEQLAECGIGSRKALAFDDEQLQELFHPTTRAERAINDAPDPSPHMFEAFQSWVEGQS